MWALRYAHGQTDRQTDRYADRNSSHPCRERSIVPGGAWQLLCFVRVEVHEVDETVRLVDICQIHVFHGCQALGVPGVIGAYLFNGRFPVQAQSLSFLGSAFFVLIGLLLALRVRQPISTSHQHVLRQPDSAFHRIDHQTPMSVMPEKKQPQQQQLEHPHWRSHRPLYQHFSRP